MTHALQTFSLRPSRQTVTVLLTGKTRNAFLACLTPVSLIMVAQTCKVAYDAVSDFCTAAYDINRHLLCFFSHPLAFRSLQAKSGTLISGSNALQFLNREVYIASDLDMYTHPGYAKRIGTWLIEEEGYHFLPTRPHVTDFAGVTHRSWAPWQTRFKNSPVTFEEDLADKYRFGGIGSVYHFHKICTAGTPPLRVQIIEAVHTPIQAILNFHSSMSVPLTACSMTI